MTEPLPARVERVVAAHRLFAPRARVVVAVSGGPDSVALLRLLHTVQPAWKLALHVAHMDHGLREESPEDAAFVRSLSAHWGVSATIERRDVRQQCARHGWSIEDGARRIRYQFLLDVARRQSASAVALAHTADDQAETVLMRLLRGTGLTGLGAIPLKRLLADDIWVVRPLLEVWRRDVLAYLQQEGVAFREDATNQDPKFLRNRIRRELLPLLERGYNPNIKGALAQLAEQSRWDSTYLQDAAGRQWKRLVKTRASAEVAIALVAFRRQPKALQRQLVRQAVAHLQGDLTQFEFRHWLEIERLFTPGRPVGTLLDLPGGVRFRREPAHVVCRRAPAAARSGSLD